MTILTDHRREVETLAYRARTFHGLSVTEALAEIAPHLTRAERASAFGDLIDGIGLRDAATKACTVDTHEVAQVLADRVTPRVAVLAAGTVYPFLLASAKIRAAIVRCDFDKRDGLDELDGLDANVDGAWDELLKIRDGYFTAASDYPDTDPDRLEELAEQALRAVLADFSFRVEHQLEQRLVEFTVLAWRFADAARLRLTGGAR
ncbi:hypothetical protein GCM10022254_09050 [Actinomadura meridiana]|uniref:Uncharacterized protein n=1 Tax=Actinomadura meridiana TaxID=559626 RepID=A0ABP8BTL5_9ACTN